MQRVALSCSAQFNCKSQLNPRTSIATMDHRGEHHNPRRKKLKVTPEYQFHTNLNRCLRTKDLSSAVALYDQAQSEKVLNLTNLNSFLHLCSSSLSDPETRKSAISFGFKLFDEFVDRNSGQKPNEATLTALARLAAADGDGDKAFDLAKSVVAPKLRSFVPAMMCYCEKGEAEKAYEVEEYVGSLGLKLEESDLAALLKVSIETGREKKVYEYLHKLRALVNVVSHSTLDVVENWFRGERAAELGSTIVDIKQVKEAIENNGGGWHGLGWLGQGQWSSHRSTISSNARCGACNRQLACVDLDVEKTEKFAESIASLALVREVQSNFKEFQDWVEQNNEYECVVDGANVGLYQQNFADGAFSIAQLDAVVKTVHKRTQKWPLVVLHKKRVRSLLDDASKRELVSEWIDQGILYETPFGSNDDWYWLYVAVKLKCLLVTNDEMRDHIFELLGSSFFFRWKERHQVHYTFSKGDLQLVMPPPYSVLIQESEDGSWHIPIAGESNEDESTRTWLCVARSCYVDGYRFKGNQVNGKS